MRRLLAAELESQPAPPLGDLVEAALRDGRRLRHTRRVRVASGSAGVTAVTVAVAAVLAFPTTPGRHPDPPAAQSSAPAAGPSPAGSATASALGPAPGQSTDPAAELTFPAQRQAGEEGRLVKATPAGVLELLTRLLPAGPRSGFGYVDDENLDGIGVQAYVDRGAGPAMVRLWLYAGTSRGSNISGCQPDEVCHAVPGGGYVAVSQIPENCISAESVTFYRPDGSALQALMSTCLMWDGDSNPPSPKIMSVQEAVNVVVDPRWALELPEEIERSGAKNFPDLAPIAGG